MKDNQINLRSCSIHRVNNGWILFGDDSMLYPPGALIPRWVFGTQKELAKFIQDNFFLPEEAQHK